MKNLFGSIGNKEKGKESLSLIVWFVTPLIFLATFSKSKLIDQNVLYLVLYVSFVPSWIFGFWIGLKAARLNLCWMIPALIALALLGLALWHHWAVLTGVALFAILTMMVLLARLRQGKQIVSAQTPNSGEL